MAGISTKSAGKLQNKRLYNGKELQSNEFTDASGLEEYDYGARFMDPQVGRWNVIDPLCEKYYSISPFIFVANDPILLLDPDGKRIKLPGNERKIAKEWLNEVGLEKAFKVSFNGVIKARHSFNVKRLGNDTKKIELYNAFKQAVDNDEDDEVSVTETNSNHWESYKSETINEPGATTYNGPYSGQKFGDPTNTNYSSYWIPVEHGKEVTTKYKLEGDNSVYLPDVNGGNIIIVRPKEISTAAAFFHYILDVAYPSDKAPQHYENLVRSIMKIGSVASPRNNNYTINPIKVTKRIY